MLAILNNVLPVFSLVALGLALLRAGLVDKAFFKVSDRLVYFIFFPALLFWKIGGRTGQAALAQDLGIFEIMPQVLGAVLIAWLASLVYIRLTNMDPYLAGSFSQVSFRFSTYVGMAVVLTAWGGPGGACLAILVGLAIPLINVLAVGTLVWFSQSQYTGWQKTMMMLKAMLGNPLIIACLLGMAYARYAPPLPVFVENTLGLASSLTLPLALLSMGAGLSLDKLRVYWRPAAAASVIKLLVLPMVGLGLLYLSGASGLAFQVAMVFFVLPSSPSCHILSSQLGGDPDLAVNAVALTTVLSFFSLSLALSLLS